MPSTTPAYNLKAVLKETGLGADTLRAWERRYGLPTPQRTEGGHRLYSDYDIAMLKWLVARQDEGLSISRAAELWKEQIAQGKDPLQELPKPQAAAQQPISHQPPETGLDSLRAQWLTACLNYNEAAAELTLNQAFSLYPIETVCTELLARALTGIGGLWYENRASVQQEHFASNLAMRRLDALIAAAPLPSRSQTLVVGCPPEEWHNFSSLLLTLFLRRRGLNVIYLGANVPINRFEETLAAVRPSLIVLSAQHLNSAATLAQTANQLYAHGATVAYGGRIFNLHPELTGHIFGHYLGLSLEKGIEKIESLLTTKTEPPAVPLPSYEHILALNLFLRKRLLVENSVNEQIRPIALDPAYFAAASQNLGNNLVSALQLGNLDYIAAELSWLENLIRVYHLPPQIVNQYLKIYAQAVNTHLGEGGKIIVDWLNNNAE